jgi:hypothetical protein
MDDERVTLTTAQLEAARWKLRALIAEGGDPREIAVAEDDVAVFEAILAAEKKGGASHERVHVR